MAYTTEEDGKSWGWGGGRLTELTDEGQEEKWALPPEEYG